MVKLRVTWKYCVAFYCVIMLYVSLHELVHHFAGYAICGDWGYKTFNYFETACEDQLKSYYATYAGPLFSFLMMYVGAYLVRAGSSDYRRHLGFAMIFAQLPLQRMVMPLFRMNDEFHASVHLFGDTPLTFWGTASVVWLVAVPPLVVAYRGIENRWKTAWFLFYLVLFPYLLWGPVFGLLEFLMVNRGVLDGTLIGIGGLFIVNEVVTIAAYLLVRRWIDPGLKIGASRRI